MDEQEIRKRIGELLGTGHHREIDALRKELHRLDGVVVKDRLL
jgi:hypothetical protein